MLGKRGGTWGKGEVGETEGGKGEVHGGKRSWGKRRGGKSGENVSFGCTGPHTEAIYDPSAIVYNVQSAPLTPVLPIPKKTLKPQLS